MLLRLAAALVRDEGLACTRKNKLQQRGGACAQAPLLCCYTRLTLSNISNLLSPSKKNKYNTTTTPSQIAKLKVKMEEDHLKKNCKK